MKLSVGAVIVIDTSSVFTGVPPQRSDGLASRFFVDGTPVTWLEEFPSLTPARRARACQFTLLYRWPNLPDRARDLQHVLLTGLHQRLSNSAAG